MFSIIVYKNYITRSPKELSGLMLGDIKELEDIRDIKDLEDLKKTFELKNPIVLCNNIKDFSALKTDNSLIFDLCISKLIDELPLIKLLPLMDKLSISKHAIKNKLRQFIDLIGKNIYIWNQLASKKEFSLYSFRKRSWPVSHKSNKEWQDDAKNIGLVERIYPGIHQIELKRKINKDKYIGEIKQTTNYGLFRYYKISKDTLYEDLFINIPDEKMAVEYVLRCMISKKYFHHILTKKVFSKLNNILTNNLRLNKIVKYSMKYMFYMLLKIERMNGKNIDKDSPCVIDEDVFREFPIFEGELDASPYFAEIYNDKRYGNLREHLIMYLGGKRKFTDRKTFLSRLDIVSDGLLTNIDLEKHNAFVTGSSLVPCLVTNPLEKNFDRFEDYIDYYYPNYYNNCEKQDKEIIDFILDKPEYSILTKKECLTKLPDIIDEEDDKELTEMYENLIKTQSRVSDMDIAVRAKTHLEYQKKVFDIFDEIIKSLPAEKANKLYLQKYKLKYGYKWILKGGKRHIEFFRINIEPQKLLYSFHVNIVRFWWDGKKLRGLASGICAALTGVNQWYKWIFNNKNPIDIIMKYMQRGYTTLINIEEIKFLKLYINRSDNYNNVKDSIIFGKAHRSHILYTGNNGIRYELEEIKVDIEDNFNSPLHWGNNYFNIKRIGFNAITTMNGKIIPPKPRDIKAAVDDLMG